MNKNYLIIIAGLFFSSCATILNSDVQKISITTGKGTRAVSIDNSMKIFGSDNSFYVRRSENPLTVHFTTDTTKQEIVVRSHNSVAYWANIYFNYGIGMLVDRDNPKRYAYPNRIYVQQQGDKIVRSRFAPTQKGTINWHIAIPYANSFYIKTPYGYRSSGGFWGIESGLDYFYKTNRYVSVYGGAATDYSIPFPAGVDYFGEYQSFSGFYINARNNYRFGRFDLGYGIAYSVLRWQVINSADSTLFAPQTKNNSALGLSLNSSFRLGKFFQLGLLYQPYLVSWDDKIKTGYQAQFSIELIWKIPITRVTP